jgi:DNA-binding CsgD family transcriptional regulator
VGHSGTGNTRPVPLAGREAELGRLIAASRAARDGHGTIALIQGEAGIGKTALLAALAGQAAADGARVAAGAAEELGQRVPFAAVASCLGLTAGPGGAAGRDAAEIAALLHGSYRPSGGTFLAADAEFLIAEAVLGLIDDWCAAGPVVLAVDDLQWADPASLLVLHRLGQVASQLPLLIAATLQSGGDRADVQRLVHGWQARDAALLPLAPLGEVGSLMAEAVRRLPELSEPAREILGAAAILGPWFTVAELSAVLARPPPDLLGVIGEAVTAGVLAAEPDRLVFRHEVIRQRLRESLPASTRNALNQRAGQALAAVGAPVERAAPHLLSGMAFDARTLRWLAGSADQLSARAPGLAADLLQRVIEVTGPGSDQAGPLRLALANALLRAGRFAAAETVADGTLNAGPAGDLTGRLRWILVQARFSRGHVSEALAEAQRALGGGLTFAERARFRGLAAQCLHMLPWTGPEAAMRAAEGARHEGLASGDPYAMAQGLHAAARASRWLGRFGQALDRAGQAAQALDRAGPVIDSQLDPHLIRADCLFDLDRDAEAQRAYATGLRLAERGVGTYFLCLHHLSVARGHFLAGRWDDALSEISAAREAPDHLGAVAYLDGLATLIAVHRQDRGELARLREALDEPLPSGTIRDTADDRSWARALAAMADGDQETALRVLVAAWQECVAGHREYCGHYLLPDLAGLAVSLGEPATARRAVAELNRYTAGRDGPALRRSAQFATAILDADARALDLVADGYAIAGRPLLEALAREHAAELLAAAGRRPVARQQLDAAQDCYARLDAAWDAARADARLRAHGVRRGIRGTGRPGTGWAALTPTERKVAALVAEGRSNPDIASRMLTSRRTVQHHVSAILAKLGLSSRAELATLVTRRAG